MLSLQDSRENYLWLHLQCNPQISSWLSIRFQTTPVLHSSNTLLPRQHVQRQWHQTAQGMTVFNLYFEKAFKKVPHDRVIMKLELLGIRGKALMIIADYLDNRRQKVRVGNCLWGVQDVTSGVPQGLLLGAPFLFSLHQRLARSNWTQYLIGYADDYKLISNNSAKIEIDLASLFNWCEVKEVNLHESKCNIMNFKKTSYVQMNHKNVNVARNEKGLGIILSDTLNWNENANRRHCKAHRALWSLKQNLPSFTPIKSTINAYIGYIVPIIIFRLQGMVFK